MGHAVLVYPQLVFVGRQPRAVATDAFSIYKQSRWCRLVPHLDIQFVVALGDDGHTKLQLAVERQIILTLGGNADSLFPI